MNGSVLVAYGSRNGSTADIAAAIAAVLRTRRLDVTVRPAHQVSSVREFEFVILGSALYAGRWRRDAFRLPAKEHRALMARHVWLFQSGLSVTGPKPNPHPVPPKGRGTRAGDRRARTGDLQRMPDPAVRSPGYWRGTARRVAITGNGTASNVGRGRWPMRSAA